MSRCQKGLGKKRVGKKWNYIVFRWEKYQFTEKSRLFLESSKMLVKKKKLLDCLSPKTFASFKSCVKNAKKKIGCFWKVKKLVGRGGLSRCLNISRALCLKYTDSFTHCKTKMRLISFLLHNLGFLNDEPTQSICCLFLLWPLDYRRGANLSYTLSSHPKSLIRCCHLWQENFLLLPQRKINCAKTQNFIHLLPLDSAILAFFHSTDSLTICFLSNKNIKHLDRNIVVLNYSLSLL